VDIATRMDPARARLLGLVPGVPHTASGQAYAPPPDPPEQQPLDPDPGSDMASRLIPGGNFILDTDPMPRPMWGEQDRVVWADGEALIIAGAQGVGKSTIAQQIGLGWIGIPGYSSLLGFPIEQGARLLYLAMDRPRQIARSLRRMVSDDQRELLNEKLLVWQGPPPADLAKYPSLLLHLCDKAYADAVIVDSLKDAAVGLSDDDVGAGYNRARQFAIAKGIQVIELHHLRKALSGAKAAHPTIDDVYGSTWITSGAGSVILLNGKPGDAIVTFHHLKQPVAPVGPFQILHNDVTGRSTIWHEVNLVELARVKGGISAMDAAKAIRHRKADR
jgi:replicative DNA helicase